MAKEDKKDKIQKYYNEDISNSEGYLHITHGKDLRIYYSYQLTTSRVYLDIGDGHTFTIPGVLDVLDEAIEWLGKKKWREVLLCGSIVTIAQLRSDLRKYYVGLPDNYTINMSYGVIVAEHPQILPIGKNSQGKVVEKKCVAIAETSKRKTASVSFLNPLTGRMGPMEGREADILDAYLLLLHGSSIDSRLMESIDAYREAFKERIREFSPKLYENLVSNSLL